MFQKCQSAFFKLYFAIFMSIIMSVSILTYCDGLGVHSFLSSFCCSFFITLAIMNTLDMPRPGRLLAGKLGPRLDEETLQKAAIVLFILGGVSIIVKSLLRHT